MAEDAKKPKLALVASVGKKAAEDDDEDDDSAALDELADVLGVAEGKREAFKAAFEAAVMCCKE
jgi:hypothetical protein